MSDAVQSSNHFPWELFLLLLVYICLELGCYMRRGKLYSTMLLYHIKHIILSVSAELMSRDGGKKLCGILLAFIIVSILFVLGYGFHSIFTHPDATDPLILTVMITIFAFPIVIALHWINTQYISWIKK